MVYPGMSAQHNRLAELAEPGLVGAFRVKAIEGGVSLSIDAPVTPPQRTMFADYVQCDRCRDGVSLVFGKCDVGPEPRSVRNVLEISFPKRSFLNQLYRSVAERQLEQTESFIQTAARVLKEFDYEKISSLPVLPPSSQAGSIRANAAFFALYEDDAAIDFFHLDAAVLRGLAQTQDLRLIQGLKGLIRIIVSPPILDYLMTRCAAVAAELEGPLQSAAETKTLEQG